jgi:uncharacterized protein YndB with AHSA1/START domain
MKETMNDLAAVSSVSIEAPVSKVWESLTTPPLIKQYLHGTDVETDWKPGSPIVFRGQWKGKAYEDKGTIKKVEQNRLLQYSFWSSLAGKPDDPENYILVTYKLEDQKGKTVLTVTSEDPGADEKTKEHMAQNWDMVLKSMKDLLER